ncbi:major pollen allergen Lig v 1-like [Lycium barbarum]|uniref:major pollen allergen Lig v 1-like n=1 Tax=Lycium barbarum TaxID=112863 RepID=UPI00293F2112|nr:major pollen allergen Lig v 1-like [Lycium barbarum]
MEKSVGILIASTICLFFLLGITQASKESQKPHFFVEGIVYCDPCRSLFKTNLSVPLEAAGVRVRCTDPKTHKVTFDMPSVTNSTGFYSVRVEGDHKNAICSVLLMESPMENCNETPCGKLDYETFNVTLTNNKNNDNNNGNIRRVNDFYFFAKEASPKCKQEFKNMQDIPKLKHMIRCGPFTYM